jgi:hypothetical protein
MEEPVVNERERKHAHSLQARGIKIPPVWYKHDALFSLFCNASSIQIPDAERFVVDTVREAARAGSFPGLETEIEKLIHEEIAHSEVHDAYNEYIKTTGLSIDRHTAKIKRIARFLHRHCSLQTKLAMCATTEHFTASLAKEILETGIFEGKDVDERMDRVWTWHALEELDHRSIAFDLYIATGGTYLRRVLTGLLATVLFFYLHHTCFLSLLRQRGLLFNGRVWRRGLPHIFGKHGIYRHFFIDWLAFFRIDFHPEKIPIRNVFKQQLHHYHVESELMDYFKKLSTSRA